MIGSLKINAALQYCLSLSVSRVLLSAGAALFLHIVCQPKAKAFLCHSMCLQICSLNSGSNGNCYYIGNHDEAILVDAGISCREIERRMQRCDLPLSRVKAIFISHEHSDHIRGLSVFSKKHQIPVYITPHTLRSGRIALEAGLVKDFTGCTSIQIGGLTVTAFRKSHDAADPYSFVVECLQVRVGVFTDIGTPCQQLAKHFSICHAAFLEANYDEVMLDTGNYPYHLKARIKGGLGHLSNRQALDVFVKCRSNGLSHLVLAHLSKNNNCPTLVETLFTEHANGVHIVVASRYQETPVYHITGLAPAEVPVRRSRPSQLAFAFY